MPFKRGIWDGATPRECLADSCNLYTAVRSNLLPIPRRRYSGFTPRVRISTWGSWTADVGFDEISIVRARIDADMNATMLFGLESGLATRQMRDEWMRNCRKKDAG